MNLLAIDVYLCDQAGAVWWLQTGVVIAFDDADAESASQESSATKRRISWPIALHCVSTDVEVRGRHDRATFPACRQLSLTMSERRPEIATAPSPPRQLDRASDHSTQNRIGDRDERFAVRGSQPNQLIPNPQSPWHVVERISTPLESNLRMCGTNINESEVGGADATLLQGSQPL